jgi:hypothetical protein
MRGSFSGAILDGFPLSFETMALISSRMDGSRSASRSSSIRAVAALMASPPVHGDATRPYLAVVPFAPPGSSRDLWPFPTWRPLQTWPDDLDSMSRMTRFAGLQLGQEVARYPPAAGPEALRQPKPAEHPLVYQVEAMVNATRRYPWSSRRLASSRYWRRRDSVCWRWPPRPSRSSIAGS